MGKRGWTFICQDCESTFGEFMDHVSFNELETRLNNIKCNNCDSNNWKITGETSFAGGPELDVTDVSINCLNCFDDFYVPIKDKTKNELIEMKQEIECNSCDDERLEIGDGVR